MRYVLVLLVVVGCSSEVVVQQAPDAGGTAGAFAMMAGIAGAAGMDPAGTGGEASAGAGGIGGAGGDPVVPNADGAAGSDDAMTAEVAPPDPVTGTWRFFFGLVPGRGDVGHGRLDLTMAHNVVTGTYDSNYYCAPGMTPTVTGCANAPSGSIFGSFDPMTNLLSLTWSGGISAIGSITIDSHLDGGSMPNGTVMLWSGTTSLLIYQ